MNFRSRALLDLAYELECTLRLPGVCEGGRSEPCHANSLIWGKGGAMKAHDFAFCSGCRACHRELDQGRLMSYEDRQFNWQRAHVETMRQLWERGLVRVATNATTLSDEPRTLAVTNAAPKRRKRPSRCTTERALPRRY